MTVRRTTALWVLLLGLTFTGVVTAAYWRATVAGDEAAFANAVEGAHDRIAGRLALYTAQLLAARGLIAAAPDVGRDAFRAFVSALDLKQRYVGVRGLGFSRALPRDGREAILARLAAERPGLVLHPAGDRDELSAVAYFEPEDPGNPNVYGYDMLSEPVRREAMERARDTGEPAASRAVTLRQETDVERRNGFVLYVPVYRREADSVAARRRELVGWVFSGFRTADFFAGIFGGEHEPRVTFEVYDGNAQMFAMPRPPHEPRLSRAMSLDVGGVMWGILYHSTLAFEARSGRDFVPWLAAAGTLLSLLLFALVRAQGRARAEAEVQRRNLHEFFEQAPAAMAIVDAADLTYTLSNPQNLQLSGGRARPGRRVDEALPELEAQGVLALLRGVISSGEPVVVSEAPLRLDDPAGPREVFLNGTYQPLRDVDGKVTGIMAFGYEVTDLVRARQVRDDFLSVAGHELRTPITALALQLDSLARQIERGKFGAVAPELVARIGKARGHVARVDRLVGELLDVARIGGGRLALHLEEVDLAEVVREVVERFAADPAVGATPLHVEIAAPATGRWDRLRAEQIVMNLVSNAVKYGAGKPVDVTVGADERHARVMVRDRGIGVAEADRERIFGRFERAVSDRSYGGLGLGLWISRQLAAAMGGTISVADAEGGGSVFTVELPRAATPE